MKTKTFVFDLDGTLIFDNKPLSLTLEDSLRCILQAGNRIIFATSRSIRGVRSLLPEWCLAQPVICCNGSFIKDGSLIIEINSINHGVAIQLIQILLESYTPFYVEMGLSYFHPEGWYHPFYEQLRREAPDEFVGDPSVLYSKRIYKITLLPTSEKSSDAVLNEIKASLKHLLIYNHAGQTIDIVSSNVSKWKALSIFFEKNGQDRSNSHLIVFGNDLNDLELLKNADHSVVVGELCPDILPYASNIIQKYSADSLGNVIMGCI